VFKQPSPEQHAVAPPVQVCPAPTQLAAWQDPAVDPAGIEHVVPEQQSVAEVHAPPMPWQTEAMTHRLLVQSCEQHSAEPEQVMPVALHTGPASLMPWPPSPAPPPSMNGRQTSPTHTPLQHFAVPLQADPKGTQVDRVHFSTPLSAGRQSAPEQHWSLNWHTVSSAMQHPGSPV